MAGAQPRAEIRERPARLSGLRREPRGVADAFHGRRQGDDAGEQPVEARDGGCGEWRRGDQDVGVDISEANDRSEEHTSELQSLMRISYAVFCLKKKSIV